jgi:two-component system sensor kinase FixL
MDGRPENGALNAARAPTPDTEPPTAGRAHGSGQHAARSQTIDEMAGELARSARLAQDQAESIAHYKKMYDRLSDMAKIGVWEFDLTTDVMTWTDGVYDLFELPRNSTLDRARIVELYDKESRREMERLRATAIRTGSSFSLDIRVRTAKGNDRWIRLTADVERENGRSVRIFGSKQDITQEKLDQEKVKALQTELIHVSRRSAMGVMVATLAHELNQPLTAISNYAAGTRRALSNPERAKDIVERGLGAIEEAAARAGNIIRTLREMNKGSEVRRRPLNPGGLIREAASLAMADAGEGIGLKIELGDDLIVLADPVQIQQVFINLIKNACEAVQQSARREIEISGCRVKGAVEIRVDDTGHGIAPEMFGTLFDTFVSTKPGGMGVGLSISRTIVESHGGRISAANRQGGGASFCVALPLTLSDPLTAA